MRHRPLGWRILRTGWRSAAGGSPRGREQLLTGALLGLDPVDGPARPAGKLGRPLSSGRPGRHQGHTPGQMSEDCALLPACSHLSAQAPHPDPSMHAGTHTHTRLLPAIFCQPNDSEVVTFRVHVQSPHFAITAAWRPGSASLLKVGLHTSASQDTFTATVCNRDALQNCPGHDRKAACCMMDAVYGTF